MVTAVSTRALRTLPLAVAIGVVMVLLLPDAAHADAVSALTVLVSLFTGVWARLVAILAIAFAGYQYMFGDPHAHSAAMRTAIGIVMVFSAATIVGYFN